MVTVMDLEDILKLVNELGPYTPRITKGIKTVSRVMKDPDVQDLMALIKELSPILEAVFNPTKGA